MSRLNTLYLRLALVLVLALGAGFATMGWIFHQHDRDAQGPVFDRHLSAQILLVERLLAANPAADLSGLPGLEIALSEPPSAGLEPRLPPGLQQRLAKDLGRVLDLRPAVATPGHDGPAGNWLRLQTTPPRWLLLRPPSHPPGPAPWTWGMLVAFGVVLVGGMALLWRVQVPLRQLEKALRQLGPESAISPPLLPVQGPREVAGLAEQFNLMIDRLRRHEEDREEMLAGVAHDLRAPLTRLRLLLELEPVLRQQDILRNVDSVEAIVDQFLLFARGASGEPPSDCDLAAFLAEVVAPYESRAVSLVLAAPQSLRGDAIFPIRPSSLRRAICNLIENALEYGAPPVTVSLCFASGGYVIAVADAGAGIPESQRAAALRPFTRLDTSRLSQGHCGLGLAIAQRIAEVHGGSLTLGQGPSGGLDAVLHLPANFAG